jgi:hypothetical protein
LKFWDEEEMEKTVSRANHAVSNVEGAQRRQEQKFEARNPKQFQMTKIGKIPNKLPSDSVFRIFLILF